MKNYSDKLPRRVRSASHICQHLTSGGEDCQKVAKFEITVSIDGEIYNWIDGFQWLRLYVCEDHLPWCERDELKKKGIIK